MTPADLATLRQKALKAKKTGRTGHPRSDYVAFELALSPDVILALLDAVEERDRLKQAALVVGDRMQWTVPLFEQVAKDSDDPVTVEVVSIETRADGLKTVAMKRVADRSDKT